MADALLRGLGIHGLDALEDAAVAALVTGDPLLLVGRHGSAKTLLARRVARALKRCPEIDARGFVVQTISITCPRKSGRGRD